MTAVISDSSPEARGKTAPRARYVGDQAMRGREPERRILHDLLRRAQQGVGGVVLVEGEPGIGKSLLLGEAVGMAAGHGFSLAAGAADQLGTVLPFFALRTALGEPFARLTADDPQRDLSDALGWWISQMRAHLEQRAAATPVLVCLDDLQWASPATLTALRTLPLDLKRHPVAWLLARTSTPQHDTEYLFGLLEKDGAARVTLAPLDPDAVAAMLIEAFGVPPDQALMDLAGGAAGNPSLLTELIRGLGDDKAVRVTGGRAVLVSTQLPQRVRRVAQRRLDGLSQQARHLLETAAVLGPSFWLEDAAEMLGETPAGLLPTVEEAMDTGIMTAADNAFSFRHELLRCAVGEMIPRPARRALHRQYGQILLSRGETAALAAGHLLQAAHPGNPASLAGLDTAAARTLRSAPQTAADLAAVENFGRLDVLVSNAGIETRTSLLATSEADFDKVLAVNLKSAFFGAQFAAQQFMAQASGGLIVTISSTHEDWPMPGNIAYCVSKGGAKMLTRTAGVELGSLGIRFVNIAPGAVSTPINAVTEMTPELLKQLNEAIPLGRIAQAAEIADVVMFLSSDRAGYVNATTVTVDGGLSQSGVGL